MGRDNNQMEQKQKNTGQKLKDMIRTGGKSKKTKVILTAIAAVAIIGFGAPLVFGETEQSMTEATAEIKDIATYYSFTGNIESSDTQNVISTSSLPVKKLYVEEGDIVRKGDILLELDNDSIQSSIAQAKANVDIAQVNYEKTQGTSRSERTLAIENALTNARLNYETAELNYSRMQELFNNGAISQFDLEQAKNSYDSALLALNSATNDSSLLNQNLGQDSRTAQAQVEQAGATLENLQRQLEDSRIYADVSGTISDVYVKENEQVVMGTKLMDLVDYDNLEVEVKVDEYGLAAVHVGKEVEVYINAFDTYVKGYVTKISEVANVVNGVSYFPTTISLEADDSLRIGMSVEVKVESQRADQALTVPVNAIRTDSANQAYVEVRDGKSTTKRYVEVGINDGMTVEVLSGLNEGDMVILTEVSTGDIFGSRMF